MVGARGVLSAIVIVLCLLVSTLSVSAEPEAKTVLGDVIITEEPAYAIIQVSLNYPARYVRHFPHGSGEELRIQLAPIAVTPQEREKLFARETAPLASADAPWLAGMIYEGHIIGGPYLTLWFEQPKAFIVGQGTDFRSLVILVSQPEGQTTDLPTQPIEP